MSPPIPLVTRIVILFDWRMEYFCVLLAQEFSSIVGQINLNSRWLLKDEEAIDWKRGLRSFHWARGTNSRKVMKIFQGITESLEWGVCVCFFLGKEKRRKECVISSYV